MYDYYTKGGLSANKDAAPAPPVGPESHTDTGRTVYGGGGISPDEIAKPGRITPAEGRLSDSIFAFSMELAMGRVLGFESYKIQAPIQYGHALQATDFPMTDALFKEMKRFVADKPAFKVTPDQLDRGRSFVERQVRFELATAAYGSLAAIQVINEKDPQIARAVEAMPRARELALTASKRARARS
jgi:carboxyl-terminal processing protease